MKTMTFKKLLTAVALVFCTSFAVAQNVVTGVVSDNLGALPGVNVMLKGEKTLWFLNRNKQRWLIDAPTAAAV